MKSSCLIFSKNRAMQLDLLLTSIARHADIFASVTILYTHTTPHMLSYQYVKQEHPGPAHTPYRWIGETDFAAQVGAFLATHDTATFLVDDDVFYRPACEPDQLPWAHRLAPSVYPWRQYDPSSEDGYPLSLDGNTYATETLLPLLDFPFGNPTALEAGLATRRDRFAPEWIYGREQTLCGVPHNRVSASSGMPTMNGDADELLARYLDGERIDLDALDFSKVEAPHAEIEYEFTTTGELERRRQAMLQLQLEGG